jgi:DNA-binding MarR family transcriptional regulator
MTVNFESTELVLRLWRQVYQTYTLLKKCEDQIFEDHGLTTEQYGVLVAIDYFGGSTKVTDIARWLERSTNSISMIVDRMVKAGLVRRARSTGDRREVRVTNTSKGQDALEPANLASLEVVQKILSPLSHEDRLTLLSLLGTIKYEILEYLNPGVDIEEIKKNELKQAANLTKWLSEYGLPSTPQAKRQSGAKRKTIRRG